MSLWALLDDSNNVIEIHSTDITGVYEDKAKLIPSNQEDYVNNISFSYDASSNTFTTTNLSGLKSELKVKLSKDRYRYEVGGVINPSNNDVIIPSDRLSQASIQGAFLWLQANTSATISFKDYDGWKDLNLADVNARKNLVLKHVQDCFTREKEISDIIDAAADFTTLATNYTAAADTGWPTTSYHKSKVDANTDISVLPNWNMPGFA